MLIFEITSSPDQSVLGIHSFNLNWFLIGNTHGNLKIDDPQVINKHIIIEISEKNAILHKSIEIEKIWINNKITTSSRKIVKDTKIRIGDTYLTIHDFNLTQKYSKKEIIRENLKKINSDSSYFLIKTLVQFYEEELKKNDD